MNYLNVRQTVSAVSATITLAATVMLPSPAQPVALPRAKSPLLLLDFETEEAVARWSGTPCRVSHSPVSHGKSSLNVRFPKWQVGRDQYMPIALQWANGSGYGTRDWSHFGKAAFDAWVDGKEPLQIVVELRTDPNGKAYTKELVVEPGRKNTFELTLRDAAEVIDVGDLRSITIEGIRPTVDTTMTLDNFRLLPGDRVPLADFDLAHPNYRQTILPGANNVSATARLSPEEYGVRPAQLFLSISATGGRRTVSGRSSFKANDATASVSTSRLPAGNVILSARIVNRGSGKVLASRKWDLRKATKAEAAALKVYVDTLGNLVSGGKPFFPIGWFGNTSLDQLAEISGSKFNTILSYGTNTRSRAYMDRFLDEVQRLGMRIIYCMNDVYPTATYLDKTGWEGIRGNNRIAEAVVRAFRSHPAILAWYINDERPKELIPKLKGYYDLVRRNDPSRPCFIVIYQMPEVSYFAPTTDIMGIDRYPIPTEPVTVVRDEMKISVDGLKGHMPVWAVIQAFGWYQYNAAYPDRGRIPSAEELASGRAPTVDEERCMTYLALVHGARGLLYYCYYDLRVLPQYPELWAGLKSIAAEVSALSPILLGSKTLGPVRCTPANAPLDTSLLDLDGERYLIAVNPRSAPCTVTLHIGKAPASRVRVMFEGRYAMKVTGTELTDDFKPLAAHVYELGRVH